MTRDEAGAYYLSVICTTNRWTRGVDNINDANGSSRVLSKADRAKIRAAAKVMRDGALALDSPPSPWPANVVKPVSTVTSDLLESMSGLNYLARAKSSTATQRAWLRYYTDDTPSKAETVRLRLGLPPASSRTAGCDLKGD